LVFRWAIAAWARRRASADTFGVLAGVAGQVAGLTVEESLLAEFQFSIGWH
jgi:hypothetical protein